MILMAEKRLLEIKATLKKRQPVFLRQGAHKHKRVKQVWRSPKGLHSKMRDSRRGYKVKLQEGYHTPKAVRGLDKYGLRPTLVATIKELGALDPKLHSVILQGTLGARKKLQILDEAQKKKFTILNAKANTAEQLKKRFTERQQQRTERETKKQSLEEKAKAEEKKAAGKKTTEQQETKK